ncbi:MAG: hypothetical protein JXI43_06925 [Tissierellales bacterium]|nr:hypothetical protein [Tissierellales bacterium]
MNEPIAMQDLIFENLSGKKFPVSIQIGTPYEIKDGKGADFARCPVFVKGLDKKPHDVAGIDTFQALTLAIAYVSDRLKYFVEDGGKIYLYDGISEFEFSSHFRAFKH